MRLKLAAVTCLLVVIPSLVAASPQSPAAPKQGAAETQAGVSAPAVDPQLKADIIKLLGLMHVTEAAQQANTAAFRTMRPQLIAALPLTPHRDQVLDAYEKKLRARLGSEDFLEQTETVYAKYLSSDDVSALIQLYGSAAGQHILAVMPRITAEASQVDGEFVRESLPAIYHELCTQFPELQGKAKFCSPATHRESSEVLGEELQPPATSLSDVIAKP